MRLLYDGFFILELSKVLMYSFHNKFVKVKYGSQAKLLLQIQTRSAMRLSHETYIETCSVQLHCLILPIIQNTTLSATENKKIVGKDERRDTWNTNWRIDWSSWVFLYSLLYTVFIFFFSFFYYRKLFTEKKLNVWWFSGLQWYRKNKYR